MKRRNTKTDLGYEARCWDCGWAVRGRNGLGLAAQHHDRTGHTVQINVFGVVVYLSDEDDMKIKEMRGELLL